MTSPTRPEPMTLLQRRSVLKRINVLTLELQDPICQRFPGAREQVRAALNRERRRVALPPVE